MVARDIDEIAPDGAQPRKTWPLSLAALGIVFGDIGTSPLYAFRESFLGGPDLLVSDAHVLGVLSLIVWSLIIVISLKYLMVVMRADNHGEGGIIALVSLLNPRASERKGVRGVLVMLGLFGAALLYGDGTITPAISVLSAVEGLELATDAFKPYIIPITIGVLICLFYFQHRGTMAIGGLFGPIMLCWFLILAALGLYGIVQEPSVLRALSPHWGVQFLIEEQLVGLVVLGAVFLAVTGGETLYADMGHFGRTPIMRAWFAVVFPALLLNYFGQGALVLSDAKEIYHPFYHLAPDWALYPLVAAATVATVIASQAVISGVFSLTRQAINLDQLPRIRCIQTSEEEHGQIYIPFVNWVLMATTIGLVLGFRSSDNLASAYGVAISMDMLITSILTLFILRHWGWPLPLIITLAVLFLAMDLMFLGANLLKIFQGGWYPILAGGLVFLIMTTWKKGRALIKKNLKTDRMSVGAFVNYISEKEAKRTPGVAVVIRSSATDTAPPILIHQVERIGALQETVVFFHADVQDIPHIAASERLDVRMITDGFYAVTAHYGFMQNINIPAAMKFAAKTTLNIDLNNVTYYLGRESLIVAKEGSGMAPWRDALFIFMNRNAHHASDFFSIPPEDVIELGIQIPV